MLQSDVLFLLHCLNLSKRPPHTSIILRTGSAEPSPISASTPTPCLSAQDANANTSTRLLSESYRTTDDVVQVLYAGSEFLHCRLRLHVIHPWPRVASQRMPPREFAFLSPARSRPRFFTVVILSIRDRKS